MNTDMQYVSGEIDLTAWGVSDTFAEEIGQKYVRDLSKVIMDEFKKTPPDMYLPWTWAPDGDGLTGETASDPVMLYVGLPLGADEDERVYFGISLEPLVDDFIEGLTAFGKPVGVGKIYGDDDVEKTRALARRLRELADKLDRHCASEAEQAEFRRDHPA